MKHDKPKQAPQDDFDRTLHAYFQHEKEADDIPLERMLSSLQKDYPPPQTKPSIWKYWWTWTGMSLCAAAASVLFWVAPSNNTLSTNHQDHVTTLPRQRHLVTRGSEKPTLLVFLKRDKTVKQINSPAHVKEHDHIKLVSRWSKGGYLYVIHSDTEQPKTPMYPPSRNQPSIRVKAGNSVTLSDSLEVTGSSSKPETLWACFSQKPLYYRDVLQQLKQPQKVEAKSKPCIVLQTFRLVRSQQKPK